MRLEASIKRGVYTGIGSRKPTREGAELGHKLGFYLAHHGLTLRSGGAAGMDRAFSDGAGLRHPVQREIFLPRAVPTWCYAEVSNYLEPGSSLAVMKPSIAALLARSVQQVLGRDGLEKTLFVLYWAPVKDGTSSKAGGTRYAVRCAVAHDIPTLNLLDLGLKSAIAWVAEHA